MIEKLSDIGKAKAADFGQLFETINSRNPYSNYWFDHCELPASCGNCEASIGFCRTADQPPQYVISCRPAPIAYSGNDQWMRRFFTDGELIFNTFDSLHSFCKQYFTEEQPPPEREQPVSVDVDAITDLSNVTTKDTKKEIPPFGNFKAELEKVVVGQEQAMEAISFQVASFLKKRSPKKPLSLLAYGPPGTGKSESAKALQGIIKEQTGIDYSVVWTDLNTFKDEASVSRLIGAPPSYIGYGDPPIFEEVTRNKNTIFIFDELDKAHPEVLKTFMAILDEGRCASNKELADHSREFDFRHCIFFFTSNYDLSTNRSNTRRIGFSVSDVKAIDCADNTVKVEYKEGEAPEDDSVAQRIYESTETARKAFMSYGTLAEIASRFTGFVGYKPLSDETKIRILAKQIVEAGFEYGVRLSYISPEIMQGIVDIITSGESLTVRSFRPVIDGRLSDCFTSAEPGETYRLEGNIKSPQLTPDSK